MEHLRLRAGATALKKIRDRGLTPDLVHAVSAASGGPKWLILAEFDRYFFGDWLAEAPHPVTLVGSSVGAWRMAMYAQRDAMTVHERFLEAYVYEQSYPPMPNARQVSAECRRLLAKISEENGAEKATTNPDRPLQIVTARLNGASRVSKWGLYGRMLMAALANRRARSRLGRWAIRSVFETASAEPSLPDLDDLPTERHRLDAANFDRVLMASGAIPGVMESVRDIPGAPAGTYVDGGITDYHPALPHNTGDGITVMPHFYDHVIPGWFDKKRTDRHDSLPALDNMLVIGPSEELVKNLPYGKIPDRRDFFTFHNRREERTRYWEAVLDASKRMGEEFMELVESGKPDERIRPLAHSRVSD